MKTKEIQALEGYFKTENEHWNFHTFEMLCSVLRQGQFTNPEIPLRVFSMAVDTFTKEHETPLKAVEAFNNEMDKQNLNPSQRLFICESVLKYVKGTEYEDFDLWEIQKLLNGQTERLKGEISKLNELDKPLTENIRNTLKELMQNEIEQLPETMKGLEPVQRLNILCKLMPYVVPKTESVKFSFGEPQPQEKNWFD